jgi:hypothetical protein
MTPEQAIAKPGTVPRAIRTRRTAALVLVRTAVPARILALSVYVLVTGFRGHAEEVRPA